MHFSIRSAFTNAKRLLFSDKEKDCSQNEKKNSRKKCSSHGNDRSLSQHKVKHGLHINELSLAVFQFPNKNKKNNTRA